MSLSFLRPTWTLAVLVALLTGTATAATYTVNNSNDSGAGSLRAAITAANANPGLDTIAFAIPGAGPHSIQLLTALPGMNDPIIVDGYSQPGSALNTAALGSNAQLRIELRPATGVSLSGGLILLSDSAGSSVRGLAINRFIAGQISVTPGGLNCVITGNFLGTDPTGTVIFPSSPGTRVGASVTGDGCRIGGPARADRNVISGNSAVGVYVGGSNIVVQGNLIGTDRNGSTALANRRGISIGVTGPGTTTLNAHIGGDNGGSATPRNVISGNEVVGIEIVSGEGHIIEGNLIGLPAFPLATLPNGGPGIAITGGRNMRIGFAITGETSNAIVANAGPGVRIAGPASNTSGPQDISVFGNAIFDNAGAAIDLVGTEGVTGNDPLDADAGPNRLQNFPEFTGVRYPPGQTRLLGRLNAEPSRTYLIDLYTADECHPNGHGGSSGYLGFITATTDASGAASFEFLVNSVLDSGVATATASGNTGDQSTSEYSPCLPLGDVLFANGFQ